MQLLAVDWDSADVRYLLAEVGRGGQMRILSAGATSVESGDRPVAERIGQALANVIAQTRSSKSKVLVGLGRGQVDAAEFTVPTATEQELPLIVAGAAPSYFADSIDDATLDFLAFEPNADGTREVLAMSLSPAELSTIESVCATAGIKADRIVVRPYALRTLAGDTHQAGVTLCLCSRPSQADILLMQDGAYVAARSLKTPESATGVDRAAHLQWELQRLLLSLPDRYEDLDVDRLVVFGGDDAELEVSTTLAAALGCTAEQIDPFADIKGDDLPADTGQFAPLLGILLDETGKTQPAIDFLNPRRPPAATSRRRPTILAIAATVVLASVGAYYVQSQFNAIDEENARLQARLSELNELVKQSEPKRRVAATLTAWEASNISWLDELRDLTLRFPPSRELVANRLSISPASDGRSTLVFGGVASEPTAVDRMENSIRDRFHQLKTPGLTEKQQQDSSSWSFQTTVAISKRQPSEYVRHLSAERLAERAGSAPLADGSPVQTDQRSTEAQ